MTPTAVHCDPATELQACLDTITAIDTDALDPHGQASLVQTLTKVVAVATAKKLQALASAERSRTALRSGAASTGQWAARLTNADQVTTAREVALAQGLDHRAATQHALAHGSISAEHAHVIVRTDKQLPVTVTVEQREVVERSLLTKAQALSPSALRKAARRALAAIEDDTALVDAHENQLLHHTEQHALTRTRLTLHDNNDGTVTGHFTIPTLHGHPLRKIVQTITAPRRGHLGATHAQVGDPEARTDWDRACGEAFCELIEHLRVSGSSRVGVAAPRQPAHPNPTATAAATPIPPQRSRCSPHRR